MSVPKSHPRYLSLTTRDRIVKGVEEGVTSVHGLIAHGRGEALDYLLGERTRPFGRKAIDAAGAMLLLAERPVISVNGNVAALVPGELVKLSKVLNAPLEVNIFHTSKKRELAIRNALISSGASSVLLPSRKTKLRFIDHNRKWVHPEGIFAADVVLVPLEDGDRCEALVKNGKKVITVDLNPLSRTARTASITIVDNIVRCLPLLCERVKLLSKRPPAQLRKILSDYRNSAVLKKAERALRSGGR